jgi:signal transduction histidine kinase
MPATRARIQLASTPSTPATATASGWARALLLVTAGSLGVAMLVGHAALGQLDVTAVLEVFVGWSFAACGVLLWARRPANHLGSRMTLVGMLWLLGRTMTLVPDPVVFTAGIWLTDLWAAAFALFLLSFPTGRLTSRSDRAIVGIFLFVTVPLEFLWLLFWVPAASACPPSVANCGLLNVLAFAPDPGAARVVDTIQRVGFSTGAALLVATLGRRWVRASGPTRRQMTPVLVGAVALLPQAASWILFTVGIRLAPLQALVYLAQIAVAVAVLAVMLQARMARGAVADLVVELGQTPTPARLRDALANALGDPTLRVAYWSTREQQFVDAAGAPVELPADGEGQAVTVLERDGAPEAAIIHDAALLEEPGLVASVASAMRLAVENDRLTEEVEAQLAEVRASRARIVAAGDAERRRVERDLHDGAQQRLVALTLALRLARTRLGDDADPAVRQSLEQASDEAKAALAELRELARGIHPQILTSAGLLAAVESLAARSQVPISVDIDADARFEPAVEAIAYFVVSESLANIAKHAEASHVQVRATWHDGVLTVVVADDGRGGADPATGSGLRGLLDRVAAVDGTLEVVSPSGGGTTVTARIPSSAPTLATDPAAEQRAS